jgi:hypothetical protein
MKFLGLKSCCLDVAYYNKMVTAVKNKANVLFSATQPDKERYDNFDGDDLQIIVDRQGGRSLSQPIAADVRGYGIEDSREVSGDQQL